MDKQMQDIAVGEMVQIDGKWHEVKGRQRYQVALIGPTVALTFATRGEYMRHPEVVLPVRSDYWVDGHFIGCADSPEDAMAEVRRAYAPYEPQSVRLWTQADQDDLDAQDADYEPEPDWEVWPA